MFESDSSTSIRAAIWQASSSDLTMIARLNEFAASHIPPSARSSLDKAIARIHYRVQIGTQLAAIDRWIAHAPLPLGAP